MTVAASAQPVLPPIPPVPAPVRDVPRWWYWMAALFLTIAVALAYSNARTVPFLFDDEGSISANKSIQSWRTVLFPPGETGDTVGGRPLLNVTLAINYAITGLISDSGTGSTWTYHLVNVLIHLTAGLVLFGLVRRSLIFCRWSERNAFFCALAAATLWLLHPMQTESVTYIVQRAESFMAMLYLLTLYCFARGVEGTGTFAIGRTDSWSHAGALIGNQDSKIKISRWLMLTVVFSALGMAAKEVMVSVPLMVFLYDRAFVAGSFQETWKRRWKFYLVLLATWLVLALCLAGSGFRGGTTGFGTPMTWWMYALTQCKAIVIYFKLAFWPSPLVFDYGVFFITDPMLVLPQLVLVIMLVGAAMFAMFYWPRAGIFGALFFAVLAPSSSFIPVVSQTMAEHRMYLPLAAIVVPVVVFIAWLVLKSRERAWKYAALGVAGLVAIGFGIMTWQRNEAYQGVVSIWQDTVAKMPASHRAQNNLGCALIDAKRYDEGIPYCLEAVRLKPDYGEAYGNVGYGMSGAKRHAESIPYYEQALYYMNRIGVSSNSDRVLLNMGLSLHEIGRDIEARAAFEKAIQINPKNSATLNNLGNYEFLAGRYAEAKKFYERAVEADPKFAEAWYDLGNACVASGEFWTDAEHHYRHALQLQPDMILAQDNLARLLVAMNRPAEATPYFKNVVKDNPSSVAQLNAARAFILTGKHADAVPLLEDAAKKDPDNIEIFYLLGNARYRSGNLQGAIDAYRHAVQLNPFAVEPHGNLGSLLASESQWDEAISELKAALRLNPNYAEAHNNLANAFAQQGKDDEARAHYAEAVRLKPQMAQAHFNYARLLQRQGDIEAARKEAQEAITQRGPVGYPEAESFLNTLQQPSSPAQTKPTPAIAVPEE